MSSIFFAEWPVAAKGMPGNRSVNRRWKGTKKPGVRYRTARVFDFLEKTSLSTA